MTIYVHNHPVARLWYDDWKFCGCGNPDDVLDYLERVLAAYGVPDANKSEAEWIAARHALDATIASDSTLRLFVAYWIAAQGLTEHGGNVDGAWLSDHGRIVLGLLRNRGEEWGNDSYMVEVNEKPAIDAYLNDDGSEIVQ